jgi:hypothetical protein
VGQLVRWHVERQIQVIRQLPGRRLLGVARSAGALAKSVAGRRQRGMAPT